MNTRKLQTGKIVSVHRNDGLRKRCGCPRRQWPKCEHPWHFSFKWKDQHYRFSIDQYAERPIITRDDARDEAHRLRRLIKSGQFPPSRTPAVPATPADVTFEQFTATWRERARTEITEAQKINDAAMCARLCAVELAPGERLGDRLIGRITEDDLETALGKLGPLAGSTWNKYRQTILHLQKFGRRKGYLSRAWLSDDTEITRRKGAQRERRFIPDEFDTEGRVTVPGEERRLLDVTRDKNPWLQRLIIAALETGCRRGELLSLEWRDVSLARGEFTVRAENAKGRKPRTLPMSERLLKTSEMIRLDPAGQPHRPDAYVFGDRVGRRIADPKKSWATCCREAGITDLHFHDLRHEAGSRMLEAGWPLHHVQMMLGHADVKMTSTYLNATMQHLHDSMRRFGTRPLHSLAHRASRELPPPGNADAQVTGQPVVH